MKKSVWIKALSIVLALVIWYVVSIIVGQDMLLASPIKVMVRLVKMCFIHSYSVKDIVLFALTGLPIFLIEETFRTTILFSLFRISLGFFAAFIAGIILGVLGGRFKWIENFLWPYVVTVKAVPVASFIILCLMWMNFKQLTVLIGFLIVFPVVYSNVLAGYRSTDRNMLTMAKIYHVPESRKLLYIYVPQLKPFIVSSAKVGIGMAWKAGVAAEVIGMIDGSIGDMLYRAKIYFMNDELLALTILIVLLSVLSEKLFVLLLEGLFKGVTRL